LWMAGPCIFPSEGASNPTYTIFAVSLRGAEELAKVSKTHFRTALRSQGLPEPPKTEWKKR